jgi:ATP-dependent Clp protease ATP-binding subunit ClpB
MTSNIGSQHIKEHGAEAAREAVMSKLDRSFRPEFLNRLDEIILFANLTPEDLKQIVDIQVGRLELAEVSYDPVYGARPLKRAIQHELVDQLANAFLDGEVVEGDHIVVDLREDDEGLTFLADRPEVMESDISGDDVIEGEIVAE